MTMPRPTAISARSARSARFGGASRAPRFVFRSVPLLSAAAASAVLGACDPPPAPKFEITVMVSSDPGRPMANAVISGAGKELGKTGADGKVTLALAAREGESLDMLVTCPAGFQSPAKAIPVVFRKLPDGQRPEYPALCPPTERAAVISVHVDVVDQRDQNFIANLPVNYIGKTYTRTDAGGAGHFVVPISPDEQLTVVLDTSGVPELVPKNPTATISARNQDDIYAVDFGKLTYLRKKPKAAPPPKAKPKGPTKLGD